MQKSPLNRRRSVGFFVVGYVRFVQDTEVLSALKRLRMSWYILVLR